ncbi:MAG: UDP-N-acetyl glucosamine 2-epimerase, partial [Fidelibacterota bacterium]
ALAASKLNIDVAHIEAGLRSFNRLMPEEINRIVTDVIADYLFCPTELAVKNLAAEGITSNVYQVGDVMYDALIRFTGIAETTSNILSALDLTGREYYLMTIHRPVNADNRAQMIQLLKELSSSPCELVFPVHPRVKKQLLNLGMKQHPRIKFIEPVGYLDMLVLEKNAKAIITDSGGVQKEAYLHRVPCLTLRKETEWKETVADGWNTLVKDFRELPHLLTNLPEPRNWQPHYGEGRAADQIVTILSRIGENCGRDRG